MTVAPWFLENGVRVFPTFNKVPTVPKGTSQFAYVCGHAEASRLREYGVELGRRDGCKGGLTVVDADTVQSKAWATAHLEPTPFTVTTGPCHDGSDELGLHRYFRTHGPLPSFIRRDGLSIENRNVGLYVVGPGSVRPDGVVYLPSDWSWRWEDIPFLLGDFCFDDGSCGTFSAPGTPLVIPETAVGGERHALLHRVMRSLVAHGVPEEGAVRTCLIVNREHCRPALEDLDELDGFLRRAFFQRDRTDFVRAPKTGWVLAGALIEVGLSVEASLVAVRSITPDFDPETSA